MNNKKAIIYIFSGTGNTLIAGEFVKKYLSNYDIDADIHRITSKCDIIPDPNNFDIALFAYPIHAFNSPQFFLRFVKKLPALHDNKKGMLAYIFKTSGEPFSPNHASSFTLCHFLKKKGFIPASDMHMLMPYNIIFRYPDAMAKQMYIHTDKMAQKLSMDISSGNITKPHFNPFTIIFSYILRLQWFGAWINGPLIKAKPSLCISCGKCEKICPANNISMIEKDINGKVHIIPKFGIKCTMCMGCIMGCPTSAINPGFLTPWKVNGNWDFDRLMKDSSIPSNYTDSKEAKYFKLFNKYYSKN